MEQQKEIIKAQWPDRFLRMYICILFVSVVDSDLILWSSAQKVGSQPACRILGADRLSMLNGKFYLMVL